MPGTRGPATIIRNPASRARIRIRPSHFRFFARGAMGGSGSSSGIAVIYPRLFVSVLRLDEPDGAGLGAEHHRVRVDPVLAVSYALEKIAVGDAGGGEDDVVAGGQIGRVVDAVRIRDLHRLDPLPLVGADRLEPALDLAAQASHGGRGQHALRRAADADEHVNAGVGNGGGPRRR